MELYAHIAWPEGTNDSLRIIEKHLNTFVINKKKALKEFIPKINNKIIQKIFLAVKCGSSINKSVFVFYDGTSASSEIQGKSFEGSLEDLLNDWEFLTNMIRESGKKYTIKEFYVRLNAEKLIKANFKQYLMRREIIAFLLSLTGIPSIFSAILIGNHDWIFFIQPIVGLFLWIIISYFGYRREGNYVLRR